MVGKPTADVIERSSVEIAGEPKPDMTRRRPGRGVLVRSRKWSMSR